MNRQAHHERTAAGAATGQAPRRWLLFVHQLPPTPSNLRVRTWRRLQQLGALPLRQAVYVLPDSAATREDFEWLRSEVKGAGGDATVFVAESVDTWSDDELIDGFRRSRQAAYGELAAEIEDVTRRWDKPRRRGGRSPATGRVSDGFRERLAALERIDFFGSAGRDKVVALLDGLARRSARGQKPALAVGVASGIDRSLYVRRLWVTRPRPGVDRMSSAWLIRRFIDPEARFAFAADRESLPTAEALPFDMFGVEFSHRGDGCTFETLCQLFEIRGHAIEHMAQIVHDLDLKDGRFGAPETATIGTVIDGLQLGSGDDHQLLERGITLFESLYLTLSRASAPPRPRQVAPPRAAKPKGGRRKR